MSKLTNKHEQSYENTPSRTEQNAMNIQDAYERYGNYDNGEQESNSTMVIEGKHFAPNETEENLLLNMQENCEEHENSISGFKIANGVLDTCENKHIFAPSELEHENKMDDQPRSIVGHSLIQCCYCQTTFPYSLFELHAQTCNETMAKQRKNVLEDNLLKCQFCKSIFPDSLVEQHVETCTRRKTHKCSKCEKCFRVASKLRIHQQVHSDERLYLCKVCSKPFKFRSGLSRHMRQQHASEEEICLENLYGEKQTETCDTLQEDVRDEDDTKEDRQHKYYEGTFGREHFTTQIDLETPRGELEQETRSFKQENINFKNCCQNIITESDQSECMDTDTPVIVDFRLSPNTFVIEEKDSKKNMELENSFEVEQKQAKVSDEQTSDVPLPLQMLQRDKSKGYRCEDCPRIFEKPSRLMVHHRIHSEERLFTCEICQQTFKHKGSLTRHVKEQHYGQGRKSFSVVFDERRKMDDCTSSIKINCENIDQCLLSENGGGDYAGNSCSDESLDEGQNTLSMVYERRQEHDRSLSFQDENDFQNVDNAKEFLVNERETLKYDKEDHFQEQDYEQEQSIPSMVLVARLGDDQFLSLQDNYGFGNASNTNVNESETFKFEENTFEVQASEQDDKNYLICMVDGGRQEGERSLSPQDEVSLQSDDNTNDYHERQSENRECKQGIVEVRENIKKSGNDFGSDGRSLGNKEDSFQVNLGPSGISDECSTTTVSVDINNCKKRDIHKCTDCPRMFRRPSALRKHQGVHNDAMSFSCQICGRYFKYKGSLNRHIKEQHYGQGRKSQSVVVNEKVEDCSPLDRVSLEDTDQCLVKVNESLEYNGGTTRFSKEHDFGKGSKGDRVTVDETQGKTIFQNVYGYSLNKNESCGYEENSFKRLHHEEQNNPSHMVFDGEQGDEKTLSLPDGGSFHNTDNTEECLPRGSETYQYQGNTHSSESLEERHDSFSIRTLALPNNVTFQNVDNTSEYLVRECETYQYKSFDKEHNSHSLSFVEEKTLASPNEGSLQNVDNDDESSDNHSETYQYEETNFEENNLKKEENNPGDVQSVNMRRSKKRKVHKCQDCPRMFRTPSAMRKHRVIHNDAMSFCCQMCGRYFKYKGSLNRHVREQHYGQGRRSSYMVVDEKKGSKQNSCPPFEKVKSGVTIDLNEQHFSPGRNDVNVGVDGLQINESENSHVLDNISFDNGDKNLMRENGSYDYQETVQSSESSDELQNNRSMAFHGRHEDPRTLLVEDNLQHVDDINGKKNHENKSINYTYEENNLEDEQDDPGVIFCGKRENEKHLSLKFEVDERNSGIGKDSSEFCEENFDIGENNSSTVEIPEECVSPATLSISMEKCKGDKVYKCSDCQKVFPKPSGLRKHKRTHSDAMSFSCQICKQYFKYKDSLTRHVKEQHYGQGRKGIKMELNEMPGRKNSRRVGRLNIETSVQDALEPNMTADESPGNYKDKDIDAGNFEHVESNFEMKQRVENAQNHVIQEKDNVSMNESEHILQEINEEETKPNIKQERPKTRHFKDQHLGQQRNAANEHYFDGGQNNDVKSSLGNHSVDAKGSEDETSFKQVLQEIDQADEMSDTGDDNFEAYSLDILNTKKVHKCLECSKSFWSSSQLKEHTYKHNDAKSFACALCGKAFKFRSGLVRHNRKEHKRNGLTKDDLSQNKCFGIEGKSFVGANLKQERSNSAKEESDLRNKKHSKFCEEIEANEYVQCGGGDEHVETIVGETSKIDESCSSVGNTYPVLKDVDRITNAEVSTTQSARQKKPSTYNCNKCDAPFTKLCDFLTHQRIHK